MIFVMQVAPDPDTVARILDQDFAVGVVLVLLSIIVTGCGAGMRIMWNLLKSERAAVADERAGRTQDGKDFLKATIEIQSLMKVLAEKNDNNAIQKSIERVEGLLHQLIGQIRAPR